MFETNREIESLNEKQKTILKITINVQILNYPDLSRIRNMKRLALDFKLVFLFTISLILRTVMMWRMRRMVVRAGFIMGT